MNSPTPIPPSHQENGISFPEIASLLFRRKLTVLAFACTATLLVGYGSFQIAPTYETTSKILIANRLSDLSPLGQLFEFGATSPASTEIEILRSRESVRDLVGQRNPDGSFTGLGLTQQVDDVSTYWASKRAWRKIMDKGEPEGSITAWTDRQLPAKGVAIEFLGEGRVKIKVRGLFGHSEIYEDFTEGKPLPFLKNQIYISGKGTQDGRLYHFYSNNFQETVRNVMSRVKVNETLRGSGILNISYTDRDPVRAAKVVRYLTNAYIQNGEAQLRRPSTQSREFIESEIDSVRADLEDSEQKFIEFQTLHGGATILSEAALVLVEKLSQLDLDLARKKYSLQASEGALKAWEAGELTIEEALIAASHNPFSSVFNPITGNYGQVVGAYDPLAIQLIAELGQMQSTQAQMSLEHPAEWPGLKKSAARIGLIKSKMESKIRSDLMRLGVEEKALGDLLEEYKIELNEYPETERKLAGFQRETQALEDIYTLLLSRLHDSAIAEKAAVSAIEVVDSAIIPIKPILPRPLLFSAIAAILGALLGMVVVISREASIKPVLNARQLERVTGYAQVGVIPNFRKGRARSKGFGGIKRFGIDRNDSASFLALRDAPNSPVAEAFRALRANLPFLREGNPLKTICITSAGKGEGKSTTTADLAIALAQSGKSVLLIDADLRQPTQHKFFDVPLKGGLSEMLGEEENGDPSVRQTDIKNLSLIAAGAAVPNPGDLLPNGKMVKLLSELSQQYDNILLDVPPLLSVADASSFLCEVDGVFLLCRADFLPERLASAASKRLLMLKAPVLGCILNGFCPPHNSGYGDGFAYGAARYANRPPSS